MKARAYRVSMLWQSDDLWHATRTRLPNACMPFSWTRTRSSGVVVQAGWYELKTIAYRVSSEADGLPAGAIYAMLAAPEGGLYSTHHGLYLGCNGKFTKVTTDFPDEAIISLDLDSESNLWMGTVNRGILRLWPSWSGEFRCHPGLPEQSCRCVVQRQGREYLGGYECGFGTFC